MILVTGATGLIGNYITQKLLAEGLRVKAIKRKGSDISFFSNLQPQWIDCDLLDISTLDKTFEDVNIVIHAAGLVSFSNKDRDLLNQINVEGTANIVNLCIKHSVEHLVHISSVSALGIPKESRAVTEEDFQDSTSGLSAYAKSKYFGELEVWRGINEGLKATILNPSVVLGPGNWKKGSTSLFQHAYNHGRYYTKGTLNYVDARDLADLVFYFLSNKTASERYIVNGGSVSFYEFFNLATTAFQKTRPSIAIPPTLFDFFGRLSEFGQFVFGYKSQINRHTTASANGKKEYNSKKIKNIPEFKYRPLNETIDWNVISLKNKYKLD